MIKAILNGKEVTIKLTDEQMKELEDMRKKLNLPDIADKIRC